MGSYLMHLYVSNKVKEKLGLSTKFLYGSVKPDIIKTINNDRQGSHYIKVVNISGEIRELPDISKAIKSVMKLECDNEIKLGYIAHLVQDYIWFNNYIPRFASKTEER